MFNIYTCPNNSTILRMKLTQDNGLYTCFRLFLMLLDSTWKKRKKEKKINHLPAADFLEYTEENTFAPGLYRSMYLTDNAHILYFA